MCASPWLLARGDRNHAHSSLRALYIVARSTSEFQLAFVHVHCTGLCRFCHRRSSLFSALLCSRLGSALVAAAPQPRLCSLSSLLSPRLGSPLWSLLSGLVSSLVSPRLVSTPLCSPLDSGLLSTLVSSRLWSPLRSRLVSALLSSGLYSCHISTLVRSLLVSRLYSRLGLYSCRVSTLVSSLLCSHLLLSIRSCLEPLAHRA